MQIEKTEVIDNPLLEDFQLQVDKLKGITTGLGIQDYEDVKGLLKSLTNPQSPENYQKYAHTLSKFRKVKKCDTLTTLRQNLKENLRACSKSFKQ
jgi:hypothetical protein